MIAKQSDSLGHRMIYFLKGFCLGGIPIFLLSLFSSESIAMASSMALLSGLICGILAFCFGKKVVHFIVACLKEGGG